MLTVKSSPVVFMRDLELRREILAAMELRNHFDGRRPSSPRRTAHLVADSPLPANLSAQPMRILSIGDYDSLRISREWLLRQAGFHAESLTSCAPLDAFKVRSFSIALLCHTVPFERAVRIADILHRYHPRILVMRLNQSDPVGNAGFDRELDSLLSPAELLRVLREEASRLNGPLSPLP